MKRPDCTNGQRNATGPSATQWAEFLNRHDPIWETLPTCWQHGAFVGNGRLGAMIHSADNGSANRLIWEIGRSDVYDPRPAPWTGRWNVGGISTRMLIGQFHLCTAGEIQDGTMRLQLWDAELTGIVRTSLGEIRWRCLVPHEDNTIIVEWEATDGERSSHFEWQPHPGVDPTHAKNPQPDPNPPGHATDAADIPAWIQPFADGGDVVTAWTQREHDGKRFLFVAVGYKPTPGSSLEAARGDIRQATAKPAFELTRSHREWWHAYYPASFISIPDARLEGFYHIQLYKMASATRPDAPVMDLCGPWLKKNTGWPATWWNLNVQVAYWMHLTANQLHLGESLINNIDRNVDNLIANTPAEYREDSAFLGNPTGPDMRNSRFTETTAGLRRAEAKTGNTLCCLPWLMHNYFWQYRYSMDEALLRRLFPLLRRAINIFLHVLREDEDGRLHLPDGYCDEYGVAPDSSQDLALTRWGCQTLLWSAARLEIDDPLIPRWKDILARLAPYHHDATGLMMGEEMPMAISHRHFAHLFAIYPFCEINPNVPGGTELIRRSVEHWLTVPIVRLEDEFGGFTWNAAAAMMALIGDGDEAWRHLRFFLDACIHPNTIYTEWHQGAYPTIETPLMACRSLQEMLLQSWGDTIRVFPAVPATWQDAVFHQLRAEGAFLVSAARRGGETKWVEITSLAGERCRIHLGMRGPIWTDGPESLALSFPAAGVVEVNLEKGQTCLFFSGNERPDLTIAPLPIPADQANAYGVKRGFRPLFFHQPV